MYMQLDFHLCQQDSWCLPFTTGACCLPVETISPLAVLSSHLDIAAVGGR